MFLGNRGRHTYLENRRMYVPGKPTYPQIMGMYVSGKHTYLENRGMYVSWKHTYPQIMGMYVSGYWETYVPPNYGYVSGYWETYIPRKL